MRTVRIICHLALLAMSLSIVGCKKSSSDPSPVPVTPTSSTSNASSGQAATLVLSSNGTEDTRQTFRYDVSKRLSEFVYGSTDYLADTGRIRLRYNDDATLKTSIGSPTSIGGLKDIEGIVYNSNKQILSIRSFAGSNRSFTDTLNFAYAANGNATSCTLGRTDRRWDYFYSASGKLTSAILRGGSKGDYTVTIQYNADSTEVIGYAGATDRYLEVSFPRLVYFKRPSGFASSSVDNDLAPWGIALAPKFLGVLPPAVLQKLGLRTLFWKETNAGQSFSSSNANSLSATTSSQDGKTLIRITDATATNLTYELTVIQ